MENCKKSQQKKDQTQNKYTKKEELHAEPFSNKYYDYMNKSFCNHHALQV